MAWSNDWTWQLLKFTDLSKNASAVLGFNTWSDGLSLSISAGDHSMLVRQNQTVLKQVYLRSTELAIKCRDNSIFVDTTFRGVPCKFRFRTMNIEECRQIRLILRNYTDVQEVGNTGGQNDGFSQNTHSPVHHFTPPVGSQNSFKSSQNLAAIQSPLQHFTPPAGSQNLPAVHSPLQHFASPVGSQNSFKSSSGSIFSNGSASNVDLMHCFSQETFVKEKPVTNLSLYDNLNSSDLYSQPQAKPFIPPFQASRTAFSQPAPSSSTSYQALMNVPNRRYSQLMESPLAAPTPVEHPTLPPVLSPVKALNLAESAPYRPLEPLKPTAHFVDVATQTDDELDYYMKCDMKVLLETMLQKQSFKMLVDRICETLKRDREAKGARFDKLSSRMPISIRRRGPNGDYLTPRKSLVTGGSSNEDSEVVVIEGDATDSSQNVSIGMPPGQ